MEKKVSTKELPEFLLTSIRRNQNKFTKREILVRIEDSVTIRASLHAPEYDNFDYGYYLLVDLKSKSVEYPQKGLRRPDVGFRGDEKKVVLGDDQFLVYGDKLDNHASLTCNAHTFDKNFGDIKTVSTVLKGASKNTILSELRKIEANLNRLMKKRLPSES